MAAALHLGAVPEMTRSGKGLAWEGLRQAEGPMEVEIAETGATGEGIAEEGGMEGAAEGAAELVSGEAVERKRRWSWKDLVWWAVILMVVIPFWPSRWGGPFTAVVVAGNSMEPTYLLGEVALAWSGDPEVGETIVYRIPEGYAGEGILVMHRLVRVEGETYFTKGDNRRLEDHWEIGREDVVGVVRTKVPSGRVLLGVAKHPLFLAALVGALVMVVVWPKKNEFEVRVDEEGEPAGGEGEGREV